ncbi:MAG: hypothetical protein JWP22_3328 [Ramlibacter sp.]|nr:hypothetical protein [Ramlibacter sp.]MDB5914653.1 hypothetical protein [Ramlibacter sp.]
MSLFRRSRTALVFALLAAVVVAWVWLCDYVTLQGERTIYTVQCRGGEWRGDLCTGALSTGDRYRFRALPRHREVLFWTAGSTEPSGRFSECVIVDGRNWTCPANGEAGRTIMLALDHGTPVHDATGRTRPFHSVAKWRWLLLKAGAPAGSRADD